MLCLLYTNNAKDLPKHKLVYIQAHAFEDTTENGKHEQIQRE